jgi:hypothetical protein
MKKNKLLWNYIELFLLGFAISPFWLLFSALIITPVINILDPEEVITNYLLLCFIIFFFYVGYHIYDIFRNKYKLVKREGQMVELIKNEDDF